LTSKLPSIMVKYGFNDRLRFRGCTNTVSDKAVFVAKAAVVFRWQRSMPVPRSCSASQASGKGGTAMARHVMISADDLAMVRPRVMLEDAECWSNAGYKAASYS
jgi:hypothetical protein